MQHKWIFSFLLFLKAVSLSEPWGECGTQPLKYFSNDGYTYSNCMVECEEDELLAVCNCRDAYMPPEMYGGT